MLLDSEVGPVYVELGTDSHLKVHLVYLVDDRVPSHECSSTCRREDARDHGEQRGLACTIRTEQSEYGLIFDDQIQVIDSKFARIVLLGESAADKGIVGEVLYFSDAGTLIIYGGIGSILHHIVAELTEGPSFELIEEVVEGEEKRLPDAKLLGDYFKEIHAGQAEDEEGDVEDCDAVPHLRSQTTEGVGALVHRAVGEEQVEEPIEGKGRPDGESHWELPRVLKKSNAESSPYQIGPYGHQVPDDISSPTATQEDL